MRSIAVSTEVFAKIWADRQEGEETENQILARKYGCKIDLPKEKLSKPSGFYDKKHDVLFPEGFEIFRTYKGNDYIAVATKGFWLLKNNGKYYDSLNQLSSAVADGNENTWVNWKYRDENREEKLISNMRSDKKIKRRRKSLQQPPKEQGTNIDANLNALDSLLDNTNQNKSRPRSSGKYWIKIKNVEYGVDSYGEAIATLLKKLHENDKTFLNKLSKKETDGGTLIIATKNNLRSLNPRADDDLPDRTVEIANGWYITNCVNNIQAMQRINIICEVAKLKYRQDVLVSFDNH